MMTTLQCDGGVYFRFMSSRIECLINALRVAESELEGAIDACKVGSLLSRLEPAPTRNLNFKPRSS